MRSIFDNTNFLDAFTTDIIAAKREVVIVSSFVSKRVINKMLKVVEPVMDKLTIITRPQTDYTDDNNRRRADRCIEILENSGFNVKLKLKIHQKFAVVDGKLIWYGSINFLSFSTSEESVMRLESADIAAELLGSII